MRNTSPGCAVGSGFPENRSTSGSGGTRSTGTPVSAIARGRRASRGPLARGGRWQLRLTQQPPIAAFQLAKGFPRIAGSDNPRPGPCQAL